MGVCPRKRDGRKKYLPFFFLSNLFFSFWIVKISTDLKQPYKRASFSVFVFVNITCNHGKKMENHIGLNESKDGKMIFSGRKGGLSGPSISSAEACVLSLNSQHKEVTLPAASQQSISITALDVTGGEVGGLRWKEWMFFMEWAVGVKSTLKNSCQVAKRRCNLRSDWLT